MASFSHEILVELFRNRVELARELLHVCAGIEIPGLTFESGSIDLSQVTPTEYRADKVVIARDELRIPTAAVIIEIQRSADAEKRWTWPEYVTALRARLRCPVTLLVMIPDDRLARWARDRIETGHPGFALAPVVVAPSDIPRIDPALARDSPELAVLSTLVHLELDLAFAAFEAVQQLPETTADLYWDLILRAMPAAARQILEVRVEGYKFQSEFALRHQALGRDAEREERLGELRRLVVQIAQHRCSSVAGDLEPRLRLVTHEALSALVVSLGGARSEDEALDAIDRLLPRKP